MRPVRKDASRRINTDRHKIVRVTVAGRECQERTIVPKNRSIRRVVMMRIGGRVRVTHKGVTKTMRMKSVVRAGRVVAEVGVVCVLRKSVRERKGLSRILQRVVNSCKVSTISSRDLWWVEEEPSDWVRLWPCFSPVREVDERGEYRREYIPRISRITTITGLAKRMM